MNTKFNRVLTLFLVLVAQIFFAQQKGITGIVSDSSGALPGVSITIEGSTSGTETDFDGKFTIKANTGAILIFRYLGYEIIKKTVGASNVINVKMIEGGEELEEIVVIGYTNKKEETFPLPYLLLLQRN